MAGYGIDRMETGAYRPRNMCKTQGGRKVMNTKVIGTLDVIELSEEPENLYNVRDYPGGPGIYFIAKSKDYPNSKVFALVDDDTVTLHIAGGDGLLEKIKAEGEGEPGVEPDSEMEVGEPDAEERVLSVKDALRFIAVSRAPETVTEVIK
jgi:hypothetical protein